MLAIYLRYTCEMLAICLGNAAQPQFKVGVAAPVGVAALYVGGHQVGEHFGQMLDKAFLFVAFAFLYFLVFLACVALPRGDDRNKTLNMNTGSMGFHFRAIPEGCSPCRIIQRLDSYGISYCLSSLVNTAKIRRIIKITK